MHELVVIELCRDSAGSYCSRWFALYGARVRRYELVGSEPTDWYRDLFKEVEPAESAMSDLGRALSEADIVVTDLSDDELSRYGVSPEQLVRDGKIVSRVTPFPDAGRPATSLTIFAAAGHLALTGEADRSPVGLWGPQAEQLAGLAGFGLTLAAWLRKLEDGRGRLCLVAASELLTALDFSGLPWFTYTGQRRERGPRNSGVGPLSFPVAFYACRDGYAFVNAAGEHHWRLLAAAVDRSELVEDDRFSTVAARKKNFAQLNAELEPWFRERPRAEAVRHLQTFRVPVGPLQTVPEAVGDPQLEARSFWHAVTVPDVGVVEVPYPGRMFSETRSRIEQLPTGDAQTR
jgi:formyl-CoA transferase